MAARRIWPTSPEDKQDRQRVVTLVERVGRERLRWSIFDIKRAAQGNPELRLGTPAMLARHLYDLEGRLMHRAEDRLSGSVEDVPERRRSPHRSTRTYVLTERLAEYRVGAPVLDDLEKVYLALWVAFRARGDQPVRTGDVTAVSGQIQELLPLHHQQMANRLWTLARRAEPLIRKEEPVGEHWSRWTPLGALPDHPSFDAWVETYRGALDSGPTYGRVTEAVRDLVAMAIRATRSSDWPYGTPVRVEDLRAIAANRPNAKALLDMVQRAGRPLFRALHDATRARVGSEPPVVRLTRRLGEQSYYDVPAEPGSDRRALYLAVRDMDNVFRDRELEVLVIVG